MNSGSAIKVELLVLFQSTLDRIVRGGLLVKNVNAKMPTRNRDMPIHTVLARNKTRKPNIVTETVKISTKSTP